MAAENFITQSYQTHTHTVLVLFSQSMGLEVWCEELLHQWVWFREAMSELCILLLRSCRMPFVSFTAGAIPESGNHMNIFLLGEGEIKIGGTNQN